MSMEGEKLWVTFKYERLPTVCYICGRLGHDDMHCVARKARQVTEYQYGDWIRANGGYRGGQDKTKPRKEEHQPSSNDSGQTNPQSTAAEKTMTDSGGRSKRYDVDKAAEKQVCRGDVGDNGGSGSQVASHPSGWDSSKVSPTNMEKEELTRATRKVLKLK